MNKDIKLIITDVDGTILTDDKKMPQEVVKAIFKIKEKGILFGVASGRAKLTIDKVMPKYGIGDCIDCVVGLNGNVVSIKDKVNTYYPLDNKQLSYAYENSKHFDDISFCVYDDKINILYGDKVNSTVEEVIKINEYDFQIVDMDKWLDNKSYLKCMYIGTNEALMKIYDEVKLIETSGIRFLKSSTRMYEINSTKVSKAFGIKKICEALNIDISNVMCFGDSENDVEMISEAGVGVCMANGDDCVKQIANYTTKRDNNHGGLAYFLNDYFNL